MEVSDGRPISKNARSRIGRAPFSWHAPFAESPLSTTREIKIAMCPALPVEQDEDFAQSVCRSCYGSRLVSNEKACRCQSDATSTRNGRLMITGKKERIQQSQRATLSLQRREEERNYGRPRKACIFRVVGESGFFLSGC